MGRRQQESEGLWKPCATLAIITLISCTLVYILLSPLFTHTNGALRHLNSTTGATSLQQKQEDECCRGKEHTELWGKAVKWGSDFKVKRAEECCKACKSMCTDDGPCLCNSWVFCADRKLCGNRFGECWLKKQEDPLSPEVQESSSNVDWTSGLIYGKGVGIVALETGHGTIHMKLLPECAPQSVAYILEIFKLRYCAGCEFYRAEKRGNNWDIDGHHIVKGASGPPYALLQGTLEAQGQFFEEIPKEACPSIKRGSVAWIDGGPDFFISLANHDEWERKYTAFASVLPEDMAVVERIVELPTKSAVWSGIKVAVLKKQVSFKIKRAVNTQTHLSSSEEH